MRKACLALLLAARVTPAFAQDKTFDLRSRTGCRPRIRCKRSLEDWATAVERDFRGTSRARCFRRSAGQKPSDHYDMARDGIADVTYVNPGLPARPFPDHRRGANCRSP